MPKGSPGVKKSPEHIAAVAAALRGRPKSEAHKNALRKPKTEAHKAALREANTSEVVERRRKTMLERHGFASSKADPQRNNNRVEYWIARGMSEVEAREHISHEQRLRSRLRKNIASIWRVDHWISKGLSPEDARKRVSEIQSKNANRSLKTVSRECSIFLDAIEAASRVTIEREVLLAGRFTVDGFIESLGVVIEYFGSFWHMRPDQFEPDDIHAVTGWKASSKWAEDAGRVKLLESMGYRVFVVWDCDANDAAVDMISKEISDAC